MSDAWERARELADQHASNGGLFVRLANDGDKVVGAFLGDPYAREVHWDGERYVECAGKGACDPCANAVKASLRTSMNFYVLSERALKIVEGGVGWFKDLVKCREKYGLGKYAFEIERHGASGDTKTHYTILPDEKLSDDQVRALGKLELHDLRAVFANDGETDERRSEPKLIDERAAEQIKDRLKSAPRETVGAFLKKFGITRIRELKASDARAALAFVGAHEPASDEIDPFA